MKKITFVRLEDTKFGGAETYLQRVCQVLKSQGIEHEVMHGDIPKWLASWIKALWFSHQVKRKKADKFYFSLARITCPDIYRSGDGVHRAYMKAMGLHFWQNPLHLAYCYLEKRCFKNAKKIIANSNLVKQDIIDYYHVPADKIEVIHNGVLIPLAVDHEAVKQKLCASLNLPVDKKIILFVGSGFTRKGVDCYLQVLAKLTQDFVGIVVGKDRKIKKYQQLANKLGIGKKIHFVGQRGDVNDFYAASDILLFPARYEPFGNVVLEAMAYQNAVITTQQCGAGEFLLPEDIMVNAEDFNIAQRIDALLADEIMLSSIQQRNFQFSQNVSISLNVDKTLALIHQLTDVL